ncbi:conserved hypothetical protein of the DUF498 family [Candidatus Kinetoplastibacterium desouzaii TCC079E]|uniref:Mth938-like domain-containing protein n=1 Tax=Candidatus Kinetoplastidibacterium desouzai TCC079E TaxID=1208919 RepID=M1LS02_9PROT|nr:MTH938/NDUFAF3 family protein [Candidatus Kinetoplastibacterium desouzaii]AGF46921.1 conserved hypothetical protein of the DUF498 family [Candidatus Kinetoplastibacterium desouzaii TCC079E]
MKLYLENSNYINTIDSYGNSFIEINKKIYEKPIYFTVNSEVKEWIVDDITNISTKDISFLIKNRLLDLDLNYNLFLIGTGNKYKNIDMKIFIPLFNKGIGVEIMNTRSAIYTYNMITIQNRNIIFAASPITN